MRKPPEKALSLSPRRHLGGSSLSNLAFPPPSTMSSGCKSRGEFFNHVGHVAPPLLLAEALQPADADVVFVGFLAVREVAQLHRLDDPVDDHRGTQPGAEPQKEHLPAAVAAQGLHGGVVDHLHPAAEGLLEIEAHPAFAQVGRVAHGPVVQHGARIADTDRVIVPIGRALLHAGDHLLGGHFGTGVEFAMLAGAGDQILDVRAADVDHQYVHVIHL